MSSIAANWARYVENVVHVDERHRRQCVRATGAEETSGLDGDLRWPGYLGSDYGNARIRLLCAGQVHHGPMLEETLGDIQPALREIRQHGASRTLLKTVTAQYEKAITTWGPWSKFRKILRPLSLSETHIAYTNVAKCWQTPTNADCRLPMRVCAPVFPLDVLARSIAADAIVVISATSTLNFCGVREGNVPLYNVPGRPSDLALEALANELRRRFDRS